MDKEQLIAEFNPEPTKLSERFIEFVLAKNKELSYKFAMPSWWGKIKLQFEVENYLQNGWQDVYWKLQKAPIAKDLSGLLKDFESLYGLVMYNNFVLARLYAESSDKDRRLNVTTKEDERLRLLQRLASDDSKYDEYVQQFGHYALEPFELSDRRFNEYSRTELKKLAELTGDLKQKTGKSRLGSVAKKRSRADIDTLIALREFGKYQCLKLVAEMRRRILAESAERGIPDPFKLSWSEITERLQ